ncbi:SecD/SecF fusion protein [Lachnospiraceae bacterium A10]|nr:SecD/SecF fusion protein [Lachnospiraceae bacterium A10]
MKRMKKGKGIAVLIAYVVIIALLGYYALGVVRATMKGSDDSLKLGLDLAGGVSITYEVVGDESPSQEDMDDTIMKLQQRIENDLGDDTTTTEAAVYQVGDNRITVEIPGVSDANAMLEELGTPGQIYFIAQTDADGNTNYTYDSTSGGYVLNYDLDTLVENGSVIMTGSDVASANAAYQTNQTTNASEPIVELSLTDEGTEKFATATTAAAAAGQSIGIYYDGEFVSVPTVNSAITDGQCVIEGMSDYDEASDLASYIRIGGLDLELEELQSEVVGAQLGSDALETSFMAAGIGLLVVMVFLMFMYLVPGVVASLALLLYTTIMLGILNAFDITLTLPGIAGIILSIGMAVDANVIIFARIKEELIAGRTVANAMDTGFKKALSAIVDGNITTLIAAAVLGVIGSGTVKGFAITLALGVVISMFTALVITRILMNVFYALGVHDRKFYARMKHADGYKMRKFVEKRKIFFAASALVILAGFFSMGFHAGTGDKALNFSLEFLGGTSTTVTFDQEYTLEEIDSEIVPIVSEVTGDNDIQVQKVDGGESVIFKTKTLDLDQREELNTKLNENFGVEESNITSQNISSTIGSEMRRDSLIAVVVAALFMLLYIWFRFKDIRFASAAIIALIHDVLVVLAVYALARISVGSAFIACMLTVIGYSVNDTIVIFDRIRENLVGLKNQDEASLIEVADRSISQTLSRSISTSFTTAVTVLMLLILGVSSIREFAFPLLVGVLVGTYSSICLATELWFLMKLHIKSRVKTSKKTSKKAKKTK